MTPSEIDKRKNLDHQEITITPFRKESYCLYYTLDRKHCYGLYKHCVFEVSKC